jgi:DnaJ-class molecular chaperone
MSNVWDNVTYRRCDHCKGVGEKYDAPCPACDGHGNFREAVNPEPTPEKEVQPEVTKDSEMCGCCGRPWHRCTWLYDEDQDD